MPICNSAAAVRTSRKSQQLFTARAQLPWFYPAYIVITLIVTLKFCTKPPRYSVQGQHEMNPLYLMKHVNSQFFFTSLRGQTLRQPNEIACVEQPTVTCSWGLYEFRRALISKIMTLWVSNDLYTKVSEKKMKQKNPHKTTWWLRRQTSLTSTKINWLNKADKFKLSCKWERGNSKGSN